MSTRRGAAAVAAVVAVVVTAPVTALATHRFGDVPDSAFYHEATSEMADAGITTGCGSGENFCPDNPVTRGQMAAFLGRGLPRGAAADQSGLEQHIADTDDPQVVAFLDVEVPGDGGTQLLQFEADVVADGIDDECPCGVSFAWVVDADLDQVYDGGFTLVGAGGINGLVHTSGSVRVPSGAHSIDLLAYVIDSDPATTQGVNFAGLRTIQATSLPLSMDATAATAAEKGRGTTSAEWQARSDAMAARLLAG